MFETTESDPLVDIFEAEDEVDPFEDMFSEAPVTAPIGYGLAKAAGERAVAVGEKLQEAMDVKYGVDEKGERVFTVKLGYNDHCLLEGQLIQEITSMRGTIPQDWGVGDWRRFMDAVGAAPFRLLFGDVDRYHLLLYGAEYLRIWETSEDYHIHGQWKPRDNWDPTAENVKQDGRTIGGVDDGPFTPPVIPVTGDYGLAHVDPAAPMREQAEAKAHNKTEIEGMVARGERQHAKKRPKNEQSPNERMWEIAIDMARKPRAEWENKVDWMLEQKIKYVYGWLQETSEFPKPYPEKSLDIFWPIITYDLRDKEKVERRHAITGKVIDFWRKSVAKNGEGMDLKSNSYRVTLAAMELHEAIEQYVKAGAKFKLTDAGQEVDDKAEEMMVQKAAKKYFQAHFPIEAHGAGPGPLSTMDPDYVEYMRLRQQYKLPPGTLLHEAKL